MSDSHTQDGQFIWFAGQSATRRHHVAEFVDVGGHLITSSAFDFAMTFPGGEMRN